MKVHCIYKRYSFIKAEACSAKGGACKRPPKFHIPCTGNTKFGECSCSAERASELT